MSALLDRLEPPLEHATAPGSTRDDRLARWAPWVLATIVVLGAALLWTQAVQIHIWTQDEEYFVQLSRLLTEHFPRAVLDLPVQPYDERGIQRLTILLYAVPLTLINGETGVEIARALNCLAFTSAAIPAFLIARGVKLSAGWALIVAALTALVPWTILTGSWLTESVAYPAALWAFWGAWRACVKPGLRSDLIALGVVVVAGLARTNLLVLIVVAPIAVLLHTLASVGLRRLPRQLWRDHPLFAVLMVPGAIIAALNLAGIRPGPLASLSGGYVTSLELLDFGPIPEKFAGQVSRIVTGVGIVPIVVGLPWMLRQAVRRTAPELGALALCGLVAFGVVLFSTVYAAAEERYLMLAAPFLLIPGLVAIIRREVAGWAIVVSALAVGVLLWRVRWPMTTDAGFFLTDPSEAFVGRVLLSRLPGQGALALGLLAVAAGVAVALLLRHPRARRVGVAAVLAGLFVFQAVQSGYVVTKRVDLAGGPGDVADWTWVDDRVGDATVAIHAEGMANTNDYGAAWRDLTLWNRRVDRMVASEPVTLQIPRYAEVVDVDVDAEGRMVPKRRGERVPEYLLEPTLFRRQGVLAETVERSTYLPVELVRLKGTPRVTYRWRGADRDGWLTAQIPTASVQALPPALEAVDGDACLRVTLSGPPAIHGKQTRSTWTATTGDRRRRGTLGTGKQAIIEVPLRTGRESLRLRTSGFTPDVGDGRRLGVIVADTRVDRCGASPSR